MKAKKVHKATYQCWKDMKQRCNNPNCRRYYTHGARGIKVCKEWEKSYETFLKDMGEKPDGYTIERIDNNKGYSKDNCKWATPKEQAKNRRTNINITFNGETHNISEWAIIIGISPSSLKKRLIRYTLEKALSPKYYGHIPVNKTTKEEILEKYKTGKYYQKELAALYNITQQTISKWIVKEKKLGY